MTHDQIREQVEQELRTVMPGFSVASGNARGLIKGEVVVWSFATPGIEALMQIHVFCGDGKFTLNYRHVGGHTTYELANPAFPDDMIRDIESHLADLEFVND